MQTSILDADVNSPELQIQYGYLGNPRIKRAGVQMRFTQEQVLEYARCANDPIYFINKYYYTSTIDEGVKLIKLRPYQEQLVRMIHENRYVLSCMGRQLGKSTTVKAYILWYSLFNADKTSAILANKQAVAHEQLLGIQMAIQKLPFFIQQGCIALNAGSIVFENGSRIFASPTSSTSISGFTISLLWIDEFAKIPRCEQFYTSTYPTISSGQTSKVVITSSPYGLNLFYKLWTEAVRGENGFKTLKVDWTHGPNRGEKWKKETIANTSETQFRQEHELVFLGSTRILVDPNAIERASFMTPIKESDNLKIYELPIKQAEYMLVSDVGEGVELDYSTCQIIRISQTTEEINQKNSVSYPIVASYRNNKIAPIEFASPIFELANRYNKAWVLIELNQGGAETANTLKNDLEYENIVMGDTRIGMGRGGQQLGRGKNPGIKTTKQVKRVGCSTFRDLFESGKLIINDYETLGELSTFSEKKGSFQAEVGHHDDMILPLIIFAYATTTSWFKDLFNLDVRKLLYEQKEKQNHEALNLIAGFRDDGEIISLSPHNAPIQLQPLDLLNPVQESDNTDMSWMFQKRR